MFERAFKRRVCLALFWNMNSSTNCSFWGLLSVRLGNNFTALWHCRLFRYICNQIWAFYGFIFWNRTKQYNWRDLKEKKETTGGTGGEGRERQEKTEDEETESKRVQPDTPPGWGGDDFDANRQLDSGSSGLRFWLLQKQTNKQTNDNRPHHPRDYPQSQLLKYTLRRQFITFGGDVTVTVTWPCAMPSHDSAFLVAVTDTARKPDHGQSTSEWENATCNKNDKTWW